MSGGLRNDDEAAVHPAEEVVGRLPPDRKKPPDRKPPHRPDGSHRGVGRNGPAQAGAARCRPGRDGADRDGTVPTGTGRCRPGRPGVPPRRYRYRYGRTIASMRASSSASKSRLPIAATLSSSWRGLLAPTRAEVTRPPRSTQASASWASD